MQINVSYDTSVNSGNFSGGAAQEAAFKSAVGYVVNLFDNLFTNNVTINIDIGWGEVNGQALPTKALAATQRGGGGDYSYGTIKNALTSNANYTGDSSQFAAVATLPSTDPLSSLLGYYVPGAEAKALGLVDGRRSRDRRLDRIRHRHQLVLYPRVAPTGGAYYFVGSFEHELTEAMGRIAISGPETVMNLYRYSAPGARDSTGQSGGTAYFSYDNGNTNLGKWNPNPTEGGLPHDLGDWSQGPAPGGNDAFNDNSSPGVVNAFSTSDVTLMKLLGWDTTATPNEIGSGMTGWVSGSLPSNNLIVLSGGYLEVGSGGLATNAVVYNGGSMQVDKGGEADGSDSGAGASLQIKRGAIANGTVFFLGGTETVSGEDIRAAVDNSGSQIISSGGSAFLCQIGAGGVQNVLSGGTATITTITSGGVEIVDSSGAATFTTVGSGGSQDVYLSGSAIATTVDSGGVQIVDGTASATTIDSGGRAWVGWVSDAGAAVGSAINDTVSGGEQDVVGSGTASGTTISAGCEYVYSGGVESGATVDGGDQVVYGGGGTSYTTINSGGSEVASAGGRASYSIVNAGGSLVVSAGGTSYFTTVESGGTLLLTSDYAVATGTTVSSGGTLEIVSGYSLYQYLIGNHAYLIIGAGGSTDGTTVETASEQVLSGGVAQSTYVNQGSQTVEPGGFASATTLDAGSIQVDSGLAINTVLDSGTFQQVDGIAREPRSSTAEAGSISFPVAWPSTRRSAAAACRRSTAPPAAQPSKMTAPSTCTRAAGRTEPRSTWFGSQVIGSGGVANGTALDGNQEIHAGGAANTTTINEYGSQVIDSGGIARGTTISGGTQQIQAGGIASSTTLRGGEQIISAGGTAKGTTVDSGGEQWVGSFRLAWPVVSPVAPSSAAVVSKMLSPAAWR